MTHRPETLFTYQLALALRRGTKKKAPMKLAAVALSLNMTPDALKKMMQRCGKDRRKQSRGTPDRRDPVRE